MRSPLGGVGEMMGVGGGGFFGGGGGGGYGISINAIVGSTHLIHTSLAPESWIFQFTMYLGFSSRATPSCFLNRP